MRKPTAILKIATTGLAVLLFTVSLLVSAHSHPRANPETSHHCATCSLLPQGLQLLGSSPRLPLPLLAASIEISWTVTDPGLVYQASALPIRGPPRA